MAILSTHAANRLLTWLMTASNVPRPSAIHAALFTSASSEVSGNGYVRKVMPFANGSNRATGNTTSVTFTATGGNWGTVTHLGLYDAASGGNLLWQGALTSAKLIENGDSLDFQTGSVSIIFANT